MNQDIKIIRQKISQDELESFLGRPFSDMIKFVVDVEKKIIALGGEMHADAEEVLLEDGSKQENLWGGNIYPSLSGESKVEYNSLINIRPSYNNHSMDIKDENLKEKIKKIIYLLIL